MLAHTNSLQAVQEYVNLPTFQPSEILMKNKPHPDEQTITPQNALIASLHSPSFDIAGVLLQVRFCLQRDAMRATDLLSFVMTGTVEAG